MNFKKIVLTILLLSCQLIAQKGISPIDVDKLLQDDVISKLSSEKMMQSGSFPLGNPVDPDYYFVGPGDKLVLFNITISSNQEIIEISPENLAIIPRIGMINTKGLTLTQTKEMIKSELMKRNPNSMVSVSLYQPRNVMVTIEGNFQFPGTYTLPASYSISTAISMITSTANNSMLSVPNYSAFYNQKIKNNLNNFNSYSESGITNKKALNQRNVLIYHNDGSNEIADLDYALCYQDVKLNPYVREGDKIIIPSEPKNMPLISISGAVNNPLSIVYKNGDKAGLLFKLSGGFSQDANKDDIFIYHKDGNKVKFSENEQLKPGSIIIANKIETVKNENFGVVSIMGNVANPGTYILNSENNSLKTLIESTGGFNNDAYLPLAYIIRKDDKINEDISSIDSKYYTDLFQYSDLTMEDSTRFKNDIFNRKPVVSCDFVALFKNNDKNHNVKLQDGDLIVIPSKPTSVFVFGQVNLPGIVPFEENRNIEWYLQRAGGTAKGGKEGRARVIKGKTKVWVDANKEYIVEAGDYVYVPRSPDNPPGTDIQTYNLIVTSVFALVSILNFIVPFIK